MVLRLRSADGCVYGYNADMAKHKDLYTVFDDGTPDVRRSRSAGGRHQPLDANPAPKAELESDVPAQVPKTATADYDPNNPQGDAVVEMAKAQAGTADKRPQGANYQPVQLDIEDQTKPSAPQRIVGSPPTQRAHRVEG